MQDSRISQETLHNRPPLKRPNKFTYFSVSRIIKSSSLALFYDSLQQQRLFQSELSLPR